MTQIEMARHIGIDPSTLSRWERDHQPQKLTKAAKAIAKMLSNLT